MYLTIQWGWLTDPIRGGVLCPYTSGVEDLEARAAWKEGLEEAEKKYPGWFRIHSLLSHEVGAAATEEEARGWFLKGAFGPLDDAMLTARKALKPGPGGGPASLVSLYLHYQPRAATVAGSLPPKWGGEIGDADLAAGRKALEAAALPLRTPSKAEVVRKAILDLLRQWAGLVRAHPGSEKLTGSLRDALIGGPTAAGPLPALVAAELAMRRAAFIPGGTTPGDATGVPYLVAPLAVRPGGQAQGLNRGSTLGYLMTPTSSPAYRALQDMYTVGFLSAMEAWLTSQARQVEYSLAATLRGEGVPLPFNGKIMSAVGWWASVQRALSKASFWQKRREPYPALQFFYPFQVGPTGALVLEEGTGVPLKRQDVGAAAENQYIFLPEWVAGVYHAQGLLDQEPDGLGIGVGKSLREAAPVEFMEAYVRWVTEAGRTMQILQMVVTPASWGAGSGGGGGGEAGTSTCTHCGETHHVNRCFARGLHCSGCKKLEDVKVIAASGGEITVKVCPTLRTVQEQQGRKCAGIPGQVRGRAGPTAGVQALKDQAAGSGTSAVASAQGEQKPAVASGGAPAKGAPPPANPNSILNPKAGSFSPPNRGGGKP